MQKMQTVVTVKCMDQSLQLINAPRIASGGVNVVRAEFEFCPLWDSLVKTAVFYTDQKVVYHKVLVDDACDVPPEVLAAPGLMYMGVFGVDAAGSIVRPSVTLVLTIEEGAITEATDVSDPTPELYEQVLAEVQKAREAAEKANPVDVDLTGAPLAYVTVVEDGDEDIMVGNAVSYDAQKPTTAERKQALTNIGAVGYEVQELTEEQRNTARNNIRALSWETDVLEPGQQAQARANIGAASTMDTYGAVKYTEQELTADQKKQAAANIQSVSYLPGQNLGPNSRTAARQNIDAAQTNHASMTTDYGVADSLNFGHVRLHTAVSDRDAPGTAVTPRAVYDAINRMAVTLGEQELTEEQKQQARQNIDAAQTDHASEDKTYGVATGMKYGHVTLADAVYPQQTTGMAISPYGVYKGMKNNTVMLSAQTLTEEQKAQARENIGAAAVGEGGGEVGDITWDDISVTYGDTLTWDGNTDGLPNVARMFFKVSDVTPTYADIAKGGHVKAGEVDFDFTGEDFPEEIVAPSGIITLDVAVICPQEAAGKYDEYLGAEFPEAGTYFRKAPEMYVEELRLNDYNGFATKGKIPVDRLPLDEIGGVANWDAQEGEPGYMPNKPFERVHEVILPETELQLNPNSGQATILLEKAPIEGGIYSVVWDGVEYKCLAIGRDDGAIEFQYEDGNSSAPYVVIAYEAMCAVMAQTGANIAPMLEIYRDYVKKLDSEFLPESGVTAGQYGNYNSGMYYIPILTVDETGRVTEARQTTIYSVENGMDLGLMPYEMYSHIANGSHVTHANSTIAVGGEATMILGNCATVSSIYVSGAGYTVFPKVYGAYVYTYTDASKSNRYWVPVDPKCVKYSCSGDSMPTASLTTTAVVSLPEEYREYYAEGDSVPVLVIYEKVYRSSSSVM